MSALAASGLPAVNKVVIVVEENRGYNNIIGYPGAPYINSLANSGASFTDSHAISRPSQPNYLAFFSGSTQGVSSNNLPAGIPYSTPNLGAELLAAGKTFTGYSQGLPAVGSQVTSSGPYYRKHNPWSNWQDDTLPRPANRLPSSVNQPYTSWPANFANLPTVSIVVPDQNNDMHDGSIEQGDTWLGANIESYKNWAAINNSLLIVTWDEDDFTADNHVATIFWGPMIQPGLYGDRIDHYNVLRTLEDLFDLSHAGAAATATPITNAFVPEPGFGAIALLAPLLTRRRRS